MAEIFPDQGLDYIMAIWPRNGANSVSIALRLFSSQTAATVITSGQAASDITEVAYTNYAFQNLAASAWSANSASAGLGRKASYQQVTFPTVGATGATANGFYVTSTSAPTISAVCQANFDDAAAVYLATNDVIKVTPSLIFGN